MHRSQSFFDKQHDQLHELVLPHSLKRIEGGSFERSIISEEVDSVGNIKQIETIEVVELEDFYIADTEVTQALWKAVMSVDIYQQRANRSWPTCGVGDNYPMYFVSFRDCEKFIKKSNVVKYPSLYICKCGGKLESIAL